MSNNITGPRALGSYRPETMQTAEGRAGHVAALCAAVQRSFAADGRVDLLSWIWVQQNPNGAPAPAILSVELTGAVDEARLDAFSARVSKACELGKAIAVATVTQQYTVEILFESRAGTEVHSAEILSASDPLSPSGQRRVLGPFVDVTSARAPDRFQRFLPRAQ